MSQSKFVGIHLLAVFMQSWFFRATPSIFLFSTLCCSMGAALASTDPIQILRQEKDKTIALLNKEVDSEAKTRLQKDLEALDREIAVWEKKGRIQIAGSPASTPPQGSSIEKTTAIRNAEVSTKNSKIGVWEANTQ